MPTKNEKIQKIQNEITGISATLVRYKGMFDDNGDEGTDEQLRLDNMQKIIAGIEAKLSKIQGNNSNENEGTRGTEGIDGEVPDGDNFEGAKEIDVTKVKKITKLFEEGTIDEYGDGISHDDVDQNWIGDCYFLSALAAVAKSNPKSIEKLITGPKKDGSYDVTLYERGGFLSLDLNPQIVNVHPKTLEKDGRTTVGLGDGELWVLLVERAFAKVNGGYDEIEGGDAEKALEVITGKEASSTDVDDLTNDELVELVEKALKDKKAITTATYSSDDGSKKTVAAGKLNLHMNHEYYIISITKNDITVRNPHNNSSAGGREVTVSFSDYRKYFEDIKYLD